MKKFILGLSLVLIASQAHAMTSLFESFKSPAPAHAYKPLTNAERLEKRRSTVDYWKTVSRLVDKAGYKKDDVIYKRTHANLARAENRLATFGGRPSRLGRKARTARARTERARTLASKKGAERKTAAARAQAKAERTKPAKSARAARTKLPVEEPKKKTMMERLFGS